MAQQNIDDLQFELLVEVDVLTISYKLGMKERENLTLYKAMEILQHTPGSGFTFTTETYSFGHMITSVNGIENCEADKTAWMIYLNGKETPTGVDGLYPKTGDVFALKFEHYQGNSYEEAMLAK